MADTPRTQSALLTTLFQDGQAANSITAQDMRDLIVSLQMRGGWADYNDSATSGSPISVTGGGGAVYLTNDGAGTYSQANWINPGITAVWDVANDQFDWSELEVGDTVDIRLDVTVTTSAVNQEYNIALEMASGHASEFDIPWHYGYHKAAGVYQVVKYGGLYIGSSDILNNPAKFKITSADNCTVVVNGWYCRVVKV